MSGLPLASERPWHRRSCSETRQVAEVVPTRLRRRGLGCQQRRNSGRAEACNQRHDKENTRQLSHENNPFVTSMLGEGYRGCGAAEEGQQQIARELRDDF